jgi:hypothetical protein
MVWNERPALMSQPIRWYAKTVLVRPAVAWRECPALMS